MAQDLPPPDGFAKIPYKRKIPARGPASWIIATALAGHLLQCIWTNQEHYHVTTEVQREKKQCELLIEPLVMAESDRQLLRERYRMLRFVRESSLPVDLRFYHNPRYLDSSIPLF